MPMETEIKTELYFSSYVFHTSKINLAKENFTVAFIFEPPVELKYHNVVRILPIDAEIKEKSNSLYCIYCDVGRFKYLLISMQSI